MKNIAVFISGGGSNLQALIDAEKAGQFEGKSKISLVVSSKEDAYGLIRAKNSGIKTAVFSRKSFDTPEARDEAILKTLRAEKIDYIVLAGYLGMITPALVSGYKNKIINIHPSLLPAFGGKGFFGIKVHLAVIEAGEKTSGATVHFVDEEYDRGKIILQEAVPVLQGDTAEALQERVLSIEHKLLPLAVKKLLKGEI